jgi:4'-phosphopantetheinyl transferase
VEQIDSLQIHLWLAFLDEIRDTRRLDESRRLLSEEELEKHRRFHFERDRHRYLVTRAMVRRLLSNYVDIGPRDWRFATNEFGKPGVANEDGFAHRLSFSVSHTSQAVLLAVTLDRPVGVDVELVSSAAASIDIADRFFAPAEVRALRALPLGQQTHRFFEYWTLKESYIKARGMGLAIPLDRFAFDLDDPAQIALTLDASLQDRAERWSFWQLPLKHDHLAAVCAIRGSLATDVRSYIC